MGQKGTNGQMGGQMRTNGEGQMGTLLGRGQKDKWRTKMEDKWGRFSQHQIASQLASSFSWLFRLIIAQ
jgi:hypothetical protein